MPATRKQATNYIPYQPQSPEQLGKAKRPQQGWKTETEEEVMLSHLSLFTGIGGLDLAAEMTGEIETVGQCERKDYPTKVLEKHWPDVPRWRDIHTLTKESFYARTGRQTVDILSGGFPCQPFSTAGNRRGTEDDRYLWPQMLRVATEFKPTWFIGENVAGLISMVQPESAVVVESCTINRTPDTDYYEAVYTREENMLLQQLLKDLENIGYEVQIFIIPAAAVDAPHRRDRIAIVGYAEHDGLSTPKVSGGVAEAGDYQQKRTNTPSKSAGAGKSGNCENVAYTNSSRYLHRKLEIYTAERREPPQFELDGRSTAMAYSQCQRHRKDSYKSGGDQERNNSSQEQNGGAELCQIGSGGIDVSYTENELSQSGIGTNKTRVARFTDSYSLCNATSPGFSDRPNRTVERPEQKQELERPDRWTAEPNVGRVAHGVPDRVDRLKCLGNAVVPQQFYPIFQAIVDVTKGVGINGR